jgi:hypothetical protein
VQTKSETRRKRMILTFSKERERARNDFHSNLITIAIKVLIELRYPSYVTISRYQDSLKTFGCGVTQLNVALMRRQH